MNKSLLLLFSACMLGSIAVGQQKKKSYKEVYQVEPGAVLQINTAHADIELDSWNKNQIEIRAEITLEGATEEEAQKYFKEHGLQISGNSNKVEVNSGNIFFWAAPEVWIQEDFDMPNVDFDFDFNELAPVFEQLAIPELVDSIMVAIPEMPPMPPMKFRNFDYNKYQKEGKEYLRKWQSEVEDSMDEDYRKKMEAWANKFAERAERLELRSKRYEERAAKLEKEVEKRAEEMEKRSEEMEKRLEKRTAELEKRAAERAKLAEARIQNRFDNASKKGNRFYFRTNGDTKKYKVKTTIRIKMPKSARLQMDVKHGEVKLVSAEDMKAKFSYARFLASRVDGANTKINAAYSPIRVEDWNAGELKANYAERVDLLRVGQLNMDTTSSNVFIDRLDQSSMLSQKLGTLEIKSISKNCKTLDISVEHGELYLSLPNHPLEVYLYANASECQVPKNQLKQTTNRSKDVFRGVLGGTKASNNLSIQSQYSTVVLAQK